MGFERKTKMKRENRGNVSEYLKVKKKIIFKEPVLVDSWPIQE